MIELKINLNDLIKNMQSNWLYFDDKMAALLFLFLFIAWYQSWADTVESSLSARSTDLYRVRRPLPSQPTSTESTDLYRVYRPLPSLPTFYEFERASTIRTRYFNRLVNCLLWTFGR